MFSNFSSIFMRLESLKYQDISLGIWAQLCFGLFVIVIYFLISCMVFSIYWGSWRLVIPKVTSLSLYSFICVFFHIKKYPIMKNSHIKNNTPLKCGIVHESHIGCIAKNNPSIRRIIKIYLFLSIIIEMWKVH